MKCVLTGLERLISEKKLQNQFKGNIGYLCHSASVTQNLEHGLIALQRVFGSQLKKVFGPQHGFVTDVQDNMVESKHYVHPYFKLPIYSLYSETRIPTDEMLEGLDHILVDLQDVGTRIYTYIYTMTLLMEACAKKGIEVVILDRPNPINGNTLEGNILDLNYGSFVGRHPLPVRHALTMGEVAKMHQKYWATEKCKLTVIEMKGWNRSMSYEDTNLPWVLPSPNLATVEAAYTFVGTVLYEGTNISEGRGTTRSLEIIGHPKIEAFGFHDKLKPVLEKANLKGFVLRPLVFLPTFQKHAGIPCGGYQIHVTDRKTFEPWRLCQYLLREMYKELGSEFKWKQPPYEYEFHKSPVDLINGTDKLRLWVEKNGNEDEYQSIMKENQEEFTEQRKSILIY
ncbi:MAG: exo-beta-N-acetylmuramidase NamZ domain-containing protein [Bacteriovoracaceae bacterium]